MFWRKRNKLIKELLVLTDDLKAAVVRLSASVDSLAARQPAPPTVTGGSVADADVQAAITAINAQSDRLDKLVAPAPAPAPAAGPVLVPAAAPAPAVDLTPLTPVEKSTS